MLKSAFAAAIGVAFALSLGAAPVSAQTAPQVTPPGTTVNRPAQNNRRQTPPPTPAQNMAAAQTIATAAGLTCQVTEATLRGNSLEGAPLYEGACASGPGYLLIGSTPPVANDCVALAGAGALAREKDPAADVGVQCVLLANQNSLAVISGYAQEAGVACTVDAALAIAVNTYEIGCADADGFNIIRETTGAWTRTPCWELATKNRVCRYSTAAESNGAWTDILAGTEASACAVEQVRPVGIDGQNLAVYEIKCAAGDGFLARVNAEAKAQRIHPCADPRTAGIGGGCTLTAAPPVPTPAAQQ